MRTTQGPQRVDVIYRRIDDDFLDPAGVPAGLDAGRAGAARGLPRGPHHHRQRHRHRRRGRQVHLSLRAGDDPLLPGQEPMLGNVQTWMLRRPGGPATTCSTICPSSWSRKSTARAATACSSARRPPRRRSRTSAGRIIAAPERYIAQPTLALSTCPTFAAQGLRPRHIDLRPVRALGHGHHHRPRRPDAGGAARGLAGRQLLAGRRHQGYLGARRAAC